MADQDDDRQDALDEIRRRTHFYKKPPEGLDPTNTDPAELAEYGIPPRPDAAEFPALAEFWDDMFSPPLVFAESTFDLPDSPVRISLVLAATMTSGHNESSLNWSGVYNTPRDGQQFTEVYGRWTVPAAAVPPGLVSEFRSTVWIGLDGDRRYFNSTLPQIGSAQYVNQPIGPPYFLWFQWWMRDNPATFSPAALPIAVHPGDQILAHLEVLNETLVRFTIKNVTTNSNFLPFTMIAPTDPVTLLQAKVAGATAEWIVERPSDPVTGLYNLADFTQVNFTSCYAIQATLPPGGPPGPGLQRTLDGARLMSMYVIEGNPQRRVTISKPETPYAIDSFKVDYVGP